MRKFFLTVLLLALAGCGQAALDNSPCSDNPDEQNPTTPEQNLIEVGNPTSTMPGTVTKGPLGQALVTIYRLADDGSLGNIITTTQTDDQGRFTAQGDFSGALIIVVTGGSYTDEARGVEVELSSENELITVVADANLYETINVTPLTTIAAKRTLTLTQGNTSSLAATNYYTNKNLAKLFDLEGVDLIGTPVANLSRVSQEPKSTDPGVRYARVLAAISQALLDENKSPETMMPLISNFAEDYADGLIDDHINGDALTYYLGSLTPTHVLAALNEAIDNYILNQKYTGWTMTEFSSYWATPGDVYGTSVALTDDIILVGAPNDETAGTPSGSAYLYYYDLFSGTYAMDDPLRLTGSTALQVEDRFGQAVAATNDTLVIGAPGRDNGDIDTGSVYVYDRNFDGSWPETETIEISASDAWLSDKFGSAVAIFDDIILVGAPYSNKNAENSGAVYLFQRNADGSWPATETLIIALTDGESGDHFGSAVSIDNDRAVVGAPHPAPGNTGRAYIYIRVPEDTWQLAKAITASDTEMEDKFGQAVSISNDLIVVGAPGHDELGENTGAAYIFQKLPNGGWPSFENSKLMASDLSIDDNFGQAVSATETAISIGAPFQKDGDVQIGAAYLFIRDSAGNWPAHESIKHIPLTLAGEMHFGCSTALTEEAMIIGAPSTSSLEPGLSYLFR